jgi:hypothetical protein
MFVTETRTGSAELSDVRTYRAAVESNDWARNRQGEYLATHGSSVIMTPGNRVVRDGPVSVDSALYSSSISLSAACLEERCELVGSGALYMALRSMAMR